MDTDVRTWAEQLLARGIEIVLSTSGRLRVWPVAAFRHFTDTERDFYHTHRAELKELAESKVLPEATVVWSSPSEASDAAKPAPPGSRGHRPPSSASSPSAPGTRATFTESCVYCGDRPCVGETHHAYRALHWNSESEIERRREEATAVMLRTMGQPYQEPL